MKHFAEHLESQEQEAMLIEDEVGKKKTADGRFEYFGQNPRMQPKYPNQMEGLFGPNKRSGKERRKSRK